MGENRGRIIEMEFDLPRLIVGFGALVILVAAAFFAGRMSVPGGVPVPGGRGAPAESVAEEGEFADESGSIFDQADGGGSPRSLGRQVTRETSLGGRYEVDLGVVASRAKAETLRGVVSGAKLPAMVVGAGDGAYRVVAGPFSTEAEARRAATRLGGTLGRELTVSGGDK